MSEFIKRLWYGNWGMGRTFLLYWVVNTLFSTAGAGLVESVVSRPSTSTVVLFYLLSELVWGFLFIALSNSIKRYSGKKIYQITAEILLGLIVLMKLGVASDIADKGLKYLAVGMIFVASYLAWFHYRKLRLEKINPKI